LLARLLPRLAIADQCIVPRRDTVADLGYLPFEGDLTLSVIVISAAK
jgi:hypothetical protein